MNFYVPFHEAVDRRYPRLYAALGGGIEIVDEPELLQIMRGRSDLTPKGAVRSLLNIAENTVTYRESVAGADARLLRALAGREKIIVRQRDEWEGIEGAADVPWYEALCEIGVAF